MKNIITLNHEELILINGGHDGTAYKIGESIGGFVREVGAAVVAGYLLIRYGKDPN